MPVPNSFPARKKCMIQASFPILFSFSCASRGRLRFPASFFLYLHNNLHLLRDLGLLLRLALCLLPHPLLSCRKKDFFGRKTVPIHPVIIIGDSALIPFIQGHIFATPFLHCLSGCTNTDLMQNYFSCSRRCGLSFSWSPGRHSRKTRLLPVG